VGGREGWGDWKRKGGGEGEVGRLER